MGLLDRITTFNRRALTRYPTNVTPEAHVAWVREELSQYTIPQLYASPLDGRNNLTGETWEMRLAYRRALKEPAIKAPLRKKVLAVAKQPIIVLPGGDQNDPKNKESAAWMDWVCSNARGGKPRILHDCAIHQLIDGFGIGEMVSIPVRRGMYKGRWKLKALKFKETEEVRFKLDVYKNVVGIRSNIGGQTGKLFDPADYCLFTHMSLFESPFGISDLRAAYRAFYLIEGAIKLRGMLLENFSGPFLKYNLSDPALKEQIEGILEAARAQGYIILGPQDKLEVLNLATSAPDQFQGAIEDMRKECALAISGAYLQMLESKSPQGDSSVHADAAQLLEWYLAAEIGAVLTEQLVPTYHDPIYPDTVDRPTIQIGAVDPKVALANAQKYKFAWDLEVPASIRQFRDDLQIEPPSDDGDRLGKPKPPPGTPGLPGLPGAGPQPGLPPGGSNPVPSPGGSQLALPAAEPDADDGASLFRDGAKFTGTVTDTLQRVRHYVDGKQVAGTGPSGAHVGAGSKTAEDVPASSPKIPPASVSTHGLADLPGMTAADLPRAETFASKLHLRVYGILARADHVALRALQILPELLDEPDDLKRLGYNPAFSGTDHAGILDPVKQATGLSAHTCSAIAIQVVSRAAAIVKSRLGIAKAFADNSAAVDLIEELLNAISEEMGITVKVNREVLAAALSAGQASTFTDAPGKPVPAELLAAMLRMQDAGDEDAVAELADLAGDSEELADALDPEDDAKKFTSEYTAAQTRTGGVKAVRSGSRPLYGDAAKRALAGDTGEKRESVVDRAKRQKTEREPKREEARVKWGTSVQNPQNVRPEHVAELAANLHTLTRDEIRGMLRTLEKSGTGLKADLVDRLIRHVHGGATPSPAPQARPDGTPVATSKKDVYTVHPSALRTDPERFQYKVSGIGKGGVGDELKGTDTYNPELGGTLLAWRDPENGQDYVINGHHRHELANRAGADSVNVRYIDAANAKEARSRGALANIAEGRGTATDAAKYLRDSGQDVAHLKRAGISMTGKVAADAEQLKGLSDGAFQKLTTGAIPEGTAVTVARFLKDPKLQDTLFKKLQTREDDGKAWSPKEVETAAKKMARAGTVTEQVDGGIFGDYEDEKSTFDQEVEIESYIRAALAKTVNDYKSVSNEGRAERVAEAGNTIALDENRRRKAEAEGHFETFERQAGYKGPVAEAIKEGAATLALAKTKPERENAKRETFDRIRGLIAGGIPAPA